FAALPESLTDGLFRGPRVVWSINNDVGGADSVTGGGGADILVGGTGGDNIDAGAGNDWVAGDNARFDYVPLTGTDGPTASWIAQTTGVAFGGVDTIQG